MRRESKGLAVQGVLFIMAAFAAMFCLMALAVACAAAPARRPDPKIPGGAVLPLVALATADGAPKISYVMAAGCRFFIAGVEVSREEFNKVNRVVTRIILDDATGEITRMEADE